MSRAPGPPPSLVRREPSALVRRVAREFTGCLVCGRDNGPSSSRDLPEGRFRCDFCGAVNDSLERVAPVADYPAPVAMSLAVPTGMSMEVRPPSAPSSGPKGSPYRKAAPEPGPLIVTVRWREGRASSVLWLLVSLFLATVGVSLGGVFWLPLAIVFAFAAYASASSLLARWELRVEGKSIELRRHGLPLPSSWVRSSSTSSTRDARGWVAPQAIPPTNARHVQLVVRHQSVGQGESELEYYGIGVIDADGEYHEHAISTDIEEARFVFQVFSGWVPRSLDPSRP